ncbi:MAG: hypothetical protein IIT76_10525, partial [Prevotella sp.]|nr:hypothetical protein [Prevotella sp.]
MADFDEKDVQQFLQKHHIKDDDDLGDFYLNHLYDKSDLEEKEKQVLELLIRRGVPHKDTLRSIIAQKSQGTGSQEVKKQEDKKPQAVADFSDDDVQAFLKDHQIANENDLTDFYLNHLFDDDMTDKDKQIFGMLVENGVPQKAQERKEEHQQDKQAAQAGQTDAEKQKDEQKKKGEVVSVTDNDVQTFLKDHQIANEDDLMNFYLNHLFDDDLTEKDNQVFGMLMETGIPQAAQEKQGPASQQSQDAAGQQDKSTDAQKEQGTNAQQEKDSGTQQGQGKNSAAKTAAIAGAAVVGGAAVIGGAAAIKGAGSPQSASNQQSTNSQQQTATGQQTQANNAQQAQNTNSQQAQNTSGQQSQSTNS